MPVDMDLLNSFRRPALEGRGEIDEEVLSRAREMASSIISSPVRPMTGAQQEEVQIAAQEEAQMQQARAKLEGSPLPGFYAHGVQAGARIVSPIARLLGQGAYADTMNRTAARIEQAQREREKGGPIPDVLQSGLRGAGASMVSMFSAGMVGGPVAAIGVASAQEANRAITEGKDAGLTGRDLARYSITQGVVEGVPAAIMQKAGLGGMESLVGKRAISTGIGDALKKFGVQFTAENIEEQVTEYTHNAVSAFENVDPEALSPENIRQTAYETAVQTTLAMGLGNAIVAGKPLNIAEAHREIEAYAKEGKVPSRRVYKRWNLGPGLPGDSISQRRVVIEEIGKQLRESKSIAEAAAPGPLEASLAPAEAEGVLGPEVAQEAVVEPQGAPIGGEVVQAEPEQAVEAQIVESPPQEEEEVPPEVAADMNTVALNNAAEEEIRQVVGLDAVPKEKLEPAEALLAEVIATNAKEDALTVARGVIKKPRGVTRREHVAMVDKTRSLLGELEMAWDLQAKAAQAGDEGKFLEATSKEEEISGQLDELITASQYSGTEVSGMFSIRKMRLSRDPSDYAAVLGRVQAAIGPKGVASSKQKEEIRKLTKENAELTKENDKLTKEEQKKRDDLEVADAQEVLDANKPKKGASREYGRRVREKAETDIAKIKDEIRALGFRVNDITGVSAEGAYLIGRLGIAYIKKGAGTLIEVAGKVQADMPDAKLSFIDVMKALNARNPKVLAKGRSEQEKRVAKFRAMAKIEVQLDSLSRGIDPGITKKTPIDEDIKRLQKKLKEARKKYFYSEVSQVKLENAISKLDQLQDQLKNGQEKLKQDRTAIPPELANINEQIRGVLSEISVKEELDRTNKQIKEGIILGPVQKVKKQVSLEMERNQIQLHANRRAIRGVIIKAAPLSTWEKVMIVPGEAKTLMATGELSFTFRQNVINMFAHPIKTAGLKKKAERIGKAFRGEKITTVEESFFPSLKAAFSQNRADEINHHLRNSPNGPIYETSKLAIMDNESPDDLLRSDVFRGRYVEMVPGLGSIIRASARHGVALSNMARAVNMDHFVHMYPNATRQELNAWADVQNTWSGLGSLWKAARAAKELGVAFFSPRHSASRVQVPFKILQYWKLPRVRNEIAKDMARFGATGLSILYMASLAFPGSVEWWDVDDPDWGQIRIGNTRWDIWGGIRQPMRIVAKILLGITAKTGLIEESDRPVDWVDLFARFAIFKLGPAVTFTREALSGKTAVGEDTTITESAARHAIMLFLQDTYDAAEDGGPLMGGAVFLTTGGGFSGNTWKDSRIAAYRKVRKLRGRGRYSLANQYIAMWNSTRVKRYWDADEKKWKGEKPIVKVPPKKKT